MQVSDSNRIYDKYSNEIVKKINELKFKSDVDDERKRDIKASGKYNVYKSQIGCSLTLIFYLIFLSTADDFGRVMSGECDIEKLCLKCLKVPKGRKEEHPFFTGSLCKECSV